MPAYLVIARKWRPALFEEIVGQDHVTRTLKNAVSSGRISQAYLFSGPRGVGKTTAARILAKSLNCIEGPTSTPCNSCDACKATANGSSVDVIEIDGASNTSVDNVRELRESVRYLPSMGRYKVYIIDEVHMLSTSAFNALLKTLEEPPPHAVFIFATTEVHKIPLTILSRCQRFDFKRIPFKDIQTHLEKIVREEGLKVEGGALFTLSRESDGSLRDAQSLLEQVVSFSDGVIRDEDVATALGLMDRAILFDLLDAVVAKDAAACLKIVEKIYDFGYDLKRACSDLLEAVRDLTVVKVTGAGADNAASTGGLVELSDDELKRMNGLAGGVGVERLHMLFNIISKGYEEVSRSAYPRYSFEMALLRAVHFDDLRPISELVDRVERLARAMGTPPRSSQKGKGLDHAPKGAGVGHEAGIRGRGDGLKSADARQAAGSSGVQTDTARGHGKAAVSADTPKEAREDAAGYSPVAEDATGVETSPEALLGFVKRKVRSLSAALGSASVKVEGNSVEFSVSPDAYNAFRIKNEQLQDVCSEYLGARANISIKPVGEHAGEQKKVTDPLVQEVKRLFGGKVVEEGRRTNV